MKFEKVHIMPFALNFRPHTLSLPNTAPLVERHQTIPGIVRWKTSEWNKTEYEKVQQAVDAIAVTSMGIEIEDFVTKVAEAVGKVIPNRNFTVTLGSFAIEYKAKKEVSK